jgi:hypothetical protein
MLFGSFGTLWMPNHNSLKTNGVLAAITVVQLVPRSKTHCIWWVRTCQLMLCKEIIAVISEFDIKRTNRSREQNVELLNVKHGGALDFVRHCRVQISD